MKGDFKVSICGEYASLRSNVERGWQCVVQYWTMFSIQVGMFLASWMDGVRFDTKLPQARSRLGLHKASIKPDTYYEM